jgi:hypothetical protein
MCRTTFAAAILFLASTGFAQTPAPSFNPQELAIGDWYIVTVQQPNSSQQAVKQELAGCLVKFTDEWLVLRTMRTEARTQGVPWLSELPYAGAMFRSVSQVTQQITTWIPRASANITDRKKLAGDAGANDLQTDPPKLAGRCMIYYRDGQHDAMASGELLGVAGGQLRVATSYSEPPADGRGKPVVKKSEKQIAIGSVQYVYQQAPLKVTKKSERELAARDEKKLPAP